MLFFKEIISGHLAVVKRLKEDEKLLGKIEQAAQIIAQTYEAGGKLLICGNGGSAADSQHIAAELVGRFAMERKPLNAEALTVNTSSLTAIGNDYGYDAVFSRQVEARGRAGDVLIGISTSGGSRNVINAIKVAKENEIKTVGFTGEAGRSEICALSDICIAVPSKSTPRIQEAHILIAHMICEHVEKALFENPSG